MIAISNYYEQSQGLPRKNSYQTIPLRLADASTILREASKLGTMIGLVGCASCAFFDFNLKFSLNFTIASGVSWALYSFCAKKMEPEAQEMIQYFKDLKDGKTW